MPRRRLQGVREAGEVAGPRELGRVTLGGREALGWASGT